MVEQGTDTASGDVYTEAKASRFNFKSTSKGRSKHVRQGSEDRADGANERQTSKRPRVEREERRKQRYRHKTTTFHSHHYNDRHSTSTLDGAYYDPDSRHRESLYDNLDEAAAAFSGRAPDEVFRESLFDALADDEGAAYWEGVYGQPVHIYPDMKPGPDGKLERMSEEEYADYVRTKMWEKSHQHILEEREARDKARQKRKEQCHRLDQDVDRDEAERNDIRQRMEESLRRGEARKKAKEAEAAWNHYTSKWAHLKDAQPFGQRQDSHAQDLIPWPVSSGKAVHVSTEAIERFLKSSRCWTDDATALLKVERVRWHPDKMQQRYGQHISAEAMKLVTAVFQVIDRLWNDQRLSSSK